MAELDRLEDRLREHLRRSATVPDATAARVVAAVRARIEEAPRRRPVPVLAGIASGVVLAVVLGAALWSRTGSPSGADRPQPPAGVQQGVGVWSTTPTAFSVLDVAFGDDLHGWELGRACTDGDCVLAVRATADGGRNWTAPAPVDPEPPGTNAPAQVAFHGVRSGFVATGGLYTSADGGRTWSRTALPTGVVAVAPLEGSVWALQACPGSPPCPVRMLVSTDGGRDWAGTATQPPTGGPDAAMVRVSATDAFVSGSDAAGPAGSRLSATHDGGRSWQPLPDPCGPRPGAAAPAIAALEPTEVWVACDAPEGRAVYRSRDGGRHWELRASAAPGEHPLGAGGPLSALALAPRGPVYLGIDAGPLLRSGDGSAWTVSLDAASAGGVRRVEFVDTSHGWVVTGNGRVLATSDGGRTWTPLAP